MFGAIWTLTFAIILHLFVKTKQHRTKTNKNKKSYNILKPDNGRCCLMGIRRMKSGTYHVLPAVIRLGS